MTELEGSPEKGVNAGLFLLDEKEESYRAFGYSRILSTKHCKKVASFSGLFLNLVTIITNSRQFTQSKHMEEMKMKKLFALFCAVLLTLTLAGCGNTDISGDSAALAGDIPAETTVSEDISEQYDDIEFNVLAADITIDPILPDGVVDLILRFFNAIDKGDLSAFGSMIMAQDSSGFNSLLRIAINYFEDMDNDGFDALSEAMLYGGDIFGIYTMLEETLPLRGEKLELLVSSIVGVALYQDFILLEATIIDRDNESTTYQISLYFLDEAWGIGRVQVTDSMQSADVYFGEETSTDQNSPTDSEIKASYHKAVEAFSWFDMTTMPHDENQTVNENGRLYVRVLYDGINTLSDLYAYLRNIFTVEVINEMFNIIPNRFREFNGVLYVLGGDRGGDITRGDETHEIIRECDDRIIYRITVDVLDWDTLEEVVDTVVYDFVYTLVDGQWLFSNFNLTR